MSCSRTCMECTVCEACAKLPPGTFTAGFGLSKDQVERYSRHLLLGSFGPARQASLCTSSVLIVGCGGLGSSAALYLTAAGVGHIGLADHDIVEASNLHRQIMHTQARVGTHKALSAEEACNSLNPSVRISTHTAGLNTQNALQLVGAYDLVIDASDNAATRYLISDACVISHRPLVSAAAVGTDGQLTVYCHGENGPCYRCLFPVSPAPENCSRCSDAGVLGVVPGIMGCLQALEAIKVLTTLGDVLSQRLMTFDALAGRFSTVKLRGKREGCAACGACPSVTKDTLPGYSYEAFTGQAANDGPTALDIIPMEERFPAAEVHRIMQCAERGGHSIVMLDVRPTDQFSIMHLKGSLNLPMEAFDRAADVELCLALAAGAFVPSRRHPGQVARHRAATELEAEAVAAVEGAVAAVDVAVAADEGAVAAEEGTWRAARKAELGARKTAMMAMRQQLQLQLRQRRQHQQWQQGQRQQPHQPQQHQRWQWLLARMVLLLLLGRQQLQLQAPQPLPQPSAMLPEPRWACRATRFRNVSGPTVTTGGPEVVRPSAVQAAAVAAAAAASVAAILADCKAGVVKEVEALVAGLRQVPVFVVCRRGNNSQKAVARLRALGFNTATDIIGGGTLHAAS
ncbi:MAG: hypothetical protein WDW38_000566 [Sanguina aurantia]